MSEREGLIARIRQVRGAAAGADASARRSAADPHDVRGTTEADERVHALEARVAHLERLVEGLQDSVHRESERHAALIGDLQAQIQPGAMSAALAADARSRGI